MKKAKRARKKKKKINHRGRKTRGKKAKTSQNSSVKIQIEGQKKKNLRMNAFVYVLEFKSANHESGDQISSFLKEMSACFTKWSSFFRSTGRRRQDLKHIHQKH